MTPINATPRRLAYFAWGAVCIVWGTTYLGIRVSLESIPPALMGGLRISGVPVVDRDSRLVGIITNRDLQFERNPDRALRARCAGRRRGRLSYSLWREHQARRSQQRSTYKSYDHFPPLFDIRYISLITFLTDPQNKELFKLNFISLIF